MQQLTDRKTSIPCASVLFLAMVWCGTAFALTPPQEFPLRIRGAYDIAMEYHDGTFSIQFHPGSGPAGKGLQPGEGSWLDRPLRPAEPHLIKESFSEDQANNVESYMRDPSHYATFYCYNTQEGYFAASRAEPWTGDGRGAQPSQQPGTTQADNQSTPAPAYKSYKTYTSYMSYIDRIRFSSRDVLDRRDAYPTLSNPWRFIIFSQLVITSL